MNFGLYFTHISQNVLWTPFFILTVGHIAIVLYTIYDLSSSLCQVLAKFEFSHKK